MTDWRAEIESAVTDFEAVARLANDRPAKLNLSIEFLPAPHRPASLPAGKMAIYCFWGRGEWLKIGKVGPKSNARFLSQHYNANSARSTLAGSLIAEEAVAKIADFDPASCGAWVMANVHRCNIFVDAGQPKTLLSLLEAFLHHRLHPRYEG